MICKLQSSTRGGLCDAKNIYDALDYALDVGLVNSTWVAGWWGDKALAPAENSRSAEEWKGVLSKWNQVVDVSKPEPEKCAEIFADASYAANLVKVQGVFFSSAPYRPERLKLQLKHGPVVGTVRLTWEFLIFTGSLFDPAQQTFCRRSRPSDANDYCDPARRAQWDSEQSEQQGSAADKDDWYNHFVTIHGWGVAKGNDRGIAATPYWVVENSWGRIYENRASLGNNGAGKRYNVQNNLYTDRPDQVELMKRNHFLLVAHRVAGSGGLEIISRETYSVKV
jgi:hypothetical protein